MVISSEERFLINILFNQKKVNRSILKKINFDKLVKITSSHLMLPLLYSRLKKLELLNDIPKDLLKFLENIYNINKNRNEILLKEIDEINKTFKKNNIEYILIKGSYYIKNKIYDDLGERMIGDIDFLFRKDDNNKIKSILNEKGYKSNLVLKYLKTHHLPRLVNTQKLAAIEPHTQALLFRKRKLLSGKKILQFSKNGNTSYLADLCILNYQINDFGFLKGDYSYRTIYDLFKIRQKTPIDINNLIKSKYHKRFFIITNLLKITNIKIKYNIVDFLFVYRLKLKYSSNIFNKIDRTYCTFIKFFPKNPVQLFEFFTNSDYRKYALKSVLNFR